MRTRVAAAALAFAALPALAAVRGDGNVVTQSREAAGFDRIAAHGPLDVEVREGPAHAVSVTIDANLQPLVVTEVQGSTLHVRTRESLRGYGEGRVRVSLPSLRGVETHGSGDARIEAAAPPKDVALATTGSGDIGWRGPASALTVRIEGSGDVAVAGDVARVDVESDGSGGLRFDGKARQVRLRLSGSGDARLHGSGESLDAATDGSGDVDACDFPVRDATVATDGSGDIRIRLEGGTLRASTSGSGDVVWRGAATVERADALGSGDVVRRR